MEIPGGWGSEEEIADGDQKNQVGQRFRDGVHCTNADMKREPNEQQPAGPAVTEEQEYAADDGEDPNEGDQNDARFERPVCEVIAEAHGTGDDE